MKKAAAGRQTTTHNAKDPASDLSGWSISLQMLDTVWRVALPIVLFSLLGIWLDKHNQTKPWFTLLGIGLALSLATRLVYKQIDETYPDFFKNGDKK